MIPQENKVIISVCMITFNHAKYIAQAIDGVLMQQTSFSIELVIGEDCSTDNTRQICQEYQDKYPDKIKLLVPISNQGMISNFISTLQACSGKYIALCEGDDYWTDPYKLQKQVDFLDANEDYGFVHTDFGEINLQTGYNNASFKNSNNFVFNNGDVFDDIIAYRFHIKTCTVLFRRDLLKHVNINELQEYNGADYFLFLTFSMYTKFYYIPIVMAISHILNESASRSQNNDQLLRNSLNDYNLFQHFIKIKECSPKSQQIMHLNFCKNIIYLAVISNNKSLTITHIHTLKNKTKYKNTYYENVFFNLLKLPYLSISLSRKLTRLIKKFNNKIGINKTTLVQDNQIIFQTHFF